jgi:hypothetical protein
MQSFLSPILVHHQELVVIFVVPPRENIQLVPDNDAKNVSTESYTLTAKVQAQYPSIGL